MSTRWLSLAMLLLVCTASAEQSVPAQWTSLFDGKTSAGWRGYKAERFPEYGWVVEDGCLRRLPRVEGARRRVGDIVTVDEFGNFELELEWRLMPGGNSGIKYLISEDSRGPVSFEYQVVDDERHRDAKTATRTAGALYDLMAPTSKAVRPAGEFNKVRIIVNVNHVEHWLNDTKIVDLDRGSEDFKTRVAASKFRNVEGFGQAKKGRILLQDHGDEVWFRNIRIRELP